MQKERYVVSARLSNRKRKGGIAEGIKQHEEKGIKEADRRKTVRRKRVEERQLGEKG